VHEAAQTLDIHATLIDFHLDLELFLWRRLHRARFHIAFATFVLIATSRMPRRIVTDITNAVMARQFLHNCRYHFSHFRL
jgi:hypothetical protein